MIVSTTIRGASSAREASVSVWGFRGPLGAFVAAWGAATMLVSAPFDNWWHAAYGLDVKILSPPHMVLTLGILGISVSAVLLIGAALNRSNAARHTLELALLALGGAVLILGMTSIIELTFRSNLHRAEAYEGMAIIAPVVLLVFARATHRPWAATIVAGVFTAFMIGMLWLLPRFSATAKLGPVYQPITHYVPLEFPPLIIAPAIAIDMVRGRLATWPRWRLALVLGPVFLIALIAVEWPFAEFLMTDAAKTWVFGTHYLPYFTHPDWYEPRGEFMPEHALAIGLIKAVVIAAITSYVGLIVGDVLRKARR